MKLEKKKQFSEFKLQKKYQNKKIPWMSKRKKNININFILFEMWKLYELIQKLMDKFLIFIYSLAIHEVFCYCFIIFDSSPSVKTRLLDSMSFSFLIFFLSFLYCKIKIETAATEEKTTTRWMKYKKNKIERNQFDHYQ